MFRTGGRPLPPVDMVGVKNLEVFFGIGVVLVLILFIYLAVRYWISNKSPVGVLMLLGGVLTCTLEPFTDYIGLLWFPTKNTLFPAILHGFGVSVPWWVAVGYTWYVGGMSFYAYKRFENGITNGQLAKLVGLIALADIVLETTGLNLGVYTYYGNQPFQILGFPWWWPLTGGLMCVGIGSLVYKYKKQFTGIASLLIIALVPAGFTMFVGWVSWPIWVALDSGAGYFYSYLAGCLSLLLAAMLFKGISLEVARDTVVPVRSDIVKEGKQECAIRR